MCDLPAYADKRLIQFVRAQFLGLDENRLFFNNAAGAMRLRSVVALQERLVGSPDFPSTSGGARARNLFDHMQEGKEALRKIIDAPRGGEIIQDLSASRLLFSLADAAARGCGGENIVVTELDHPASIDGAKRAAARYGKNVIVVPADQTLHGVSVESVLDVITEKTGVLMMTCTSNTTGAQLPYVEIARQARKKVPELFIILDGVQRVPHGRVNLSQCDADALIIAPYKVFSARGSGLAWVSPRLSQAGDECLEGQSGNSWLLGSTDPVSFALMKAVGEYLTALGSQIAPEGSPLQQLQAGQDYMEQRERQLQALMLEGTENVPGLRHIPGIRIWFDQEDLSKKDFIVSLSPKACTSEALYQRLLERGVVLSLRKENSIYCGTLLKSYGSGDLLRISPMHYNTEDEILLFLKILWEALEP